MHCEGQISLDILYNDATILFRGLRALWVHTLEEWLNHLQLSKFSGGNLVKKTLCFTALCLALLSMTGLATAQLALRSPGASIGHPGISKPGAPKYCSPCLFYGGDWNDTSSDWVVFANGDVPSFGGPAVMFSAFKVPAAKTWTVTSIFANVDFISADKMDPAKPEWSVNKGMKVGKAGTVLAHGKTKGTAKVTGRSANTGLGPAVEYTIAVKLPKALTLKAGTYYEAVTPQCNNTNDSECAGALYYESDSFDATEAKQGAHHFGPAEPKGLNFQNASAFGESYIAINGTYCSSNGFPANACNYMSDGVVGTQQ
jgi:hypothetical protein